VSAAGEGWLRIRKPSSKRRQTVPATVDFLVTLLITMLLAFYLIEMLNTPAPGSDYQQQAP
jgi:hypothetical protein